MLTIHPQEIGPYLILSEIASGGMARVYKAQHKSTKKIVAIKCILPKHAKNKDYDFLFQREAELLLALQHPNLIKAHAHQKNYLIMEYIHGVSLKDLIHSQTGFIDPEVSLFIACEVLKALSFIHRQNIIHRDVSPHNILISHSGQVKLIDFGVAKKENHENSCSGIKGKFTYLSPEQIQNKKLSLSTDIFSFGSLLYEILTGEYCFKGQTEFETLKNIQRLNWSHPNSLNRNFIPVLESCLKRNPLERPTADKVLKETKKLKTLCQDEAREILATQINLIQNHQRVRKAEKPVSPYKQQTFPIHPLYEEADYTSPRDPFGKDFPS